MIKPKTILMLNQKGGVGKTTIADELAFFYERMGYDVAYKDLDGQGGALHADTPVLAGDIAIVDTPGKLDQDSAKWIRAADVIVIPTIASQRDHIVLERMREILENVRVPIVYVLNRNNPHTLMGRSFEDFWKDKLRDGDELVKLPQAEDFSKANFAGVSVHAYNSSGRASQSIDELGKLIADKIGIDIKEGDNNGD